MVVTSGEGVLLVLSGYRAGMLLNTLQCTGQLPTTKDYQDGTNAQAEKPALEGALHL